MFHEVFIWNVLESTGIYIYYFYFYYSMILPIDVTSRLDKLQNNIDDVVVIFA